MEDAKILDLYFARDEVAIRETDTAYGKRLHTLAKNILQTGRMPRKASTTPMPKSGKASRPGVPNISLRFWPRSAVTSP